MLYDPLNDDISQTAGGITALGPDDYDLVISLSEKGPGTVRAGAPKGKSWRGRVDAIVVAVEEKPDGSRYFYEAAIPWVELYPFRPIAREVCGFGFVVADNDGEGFKGGLEWTKGIWYGKDASALGDLILQAASGEGRRVLGSTGERWADEEPAPVSSHPTPSLINGLDRTDKERQEREAHRRRVEQERDAVPVRETLRELKRNPRIAPKGSLRPRQPRDVTGDPGGSKRPW